MNSSARIHGACPVRKTGYPFRLGTTSCIYGDRIIADVEKLGPQVDDIELVLFETERLSNLPRPSDITRLNVLAREHGFTYTVHLPMGVLLGHEEEKTRIRSVQKARRIMEMTAPLNPYGYIVHLEQQSFCSTAPANTKHWAGQCERSMQELASCIGHSELLCVETLSYPFSQAEGIVRACGASICLDIGHVWFNGQDARHYCTGYLPHTRVVHLHGAMAGCDHVGLPLPPDKPLLDFMAHLTAHDYRGVVTLEVFSETDFERSLQSLELVRARQPTARIEADHVT